MIYCILFHVFSQSLVTGQTAPTFCGARGRGSQARSRGEWEAGVVMRALCREHLHNLKLNGLLRKIGGRMIEEMLLVCRGCGMKSVLNSIYFRY